MFQTLAQFVRSLLGFFLVVGLLLVCSNAKAQTTAGTLWAWDQETVFACSDPLSANGLSSCFGPFAQTLPNGQMITTDGNNVYTITPSAGWGYSCPIAGPGLNNIDCKQILVGPFNPNNYDNDYLTSIAAANGYIWIAQEDGTIWRCPNNVPWTGSIPTTSEDIRATGCEQLDDAGNRYPTSLALVNGTLYAGLAPKGNKGFVDSLIWSCPSMSANACTVLDDAGNNNVVYSLTTGAGYLWAGVGDNTGIVWRCDLVMANSCSTWDTAGSVDVTGISYDGEGTLGVVTGEGTRPVGFLWSCPTSNPNSCTTLIQANKVFNAQFESVASAEGNVWGTAYIKNGSNNYSTNIFFGSQTVYSQAAQLNGAPSILYVPPGGLTASNTARVKISLTDRAAQLNKKCYHQNKLSIAVVVQGPYGRINRTVNLCNALNGKPKELELSALDKGWYTVTVSAQGYRGRTTFYLRSNRGVKSISVLLN